MIKIDPTKAADIQRQQFKAARQAKLDSLVVEVDGMAFQADELSQARIARAVLAMNDYDTTKWTLADNTVRVVSKSQLLDVMRLATQEQTRIWSTKE